MYQFDDPEVTQEDMNSLMHGGRTTGLRSTRHPTTADGSWT